MAKLHQQHSCMGMKCGHSIVDETCCCNKGGVVEFIISYLFLPYDVVDSPHLPTYIPSTEESKKIKKISSGFIEMSRKCPKREVLEELHLLICLKPFLVLLCVAICRKKIRCDSGPI